VPPVTSRKEHHGNSSVEAVMINGVSKKHEYKYGKYAKFPVPETEDAATEASRLGFQYNHWKPDLVTVHGYGYIFSLWKYAAALPRARKFPLTIFCSDSAEIDMAFEAYKKVDFDAWNSTLSEKKQLLPLPLGVEDESIEDSNSGESMRDMMESFQRSDLLSSILGGGTARSKTKKRTSPIKLDLDRERKLKAFVFDCIARFDSRYAATLRCADFKDIVYVENDKPENLLRYDKGAPKIPGIYAVDEPKAPEARKASKSASSSSSSSSRGRDGKKKDKHENQGEKEKEEEYLDNIVQDDDDDDDDDDRLIFRRRLSTNLSSESIQKIQDGVDEDLYGKKISGWNCIYPPLAMEERGKKKPAGRRKGSGEQLTVKDVVRIHLHGNSSCLCPLAFLRFSTKWRTDEEGKRKFDLYREHFFHDLSLYICRQPFYRKTYLVLVCDACKSNWTRAVSSSINDKYTDLLTYLFEKNARMEKKNWSLSYYHGERDAEHERGAFKSVQWFEEKLASLDEFLKKYVEMDGKGSESHKCAQAFLGGDEENPGNQGEAVHPDDAMGFNYKKDLEAIENQPNFSGFVLRKSSLVPLPFSMSYRRPGTGNSGCNIFKKDGASVLQVHPDEEMYDEAHDDTIEDVERDDDVTGHNGQSQQHHAGRKRLYGEMS
jgi:hypothetical protein